MRLQSVSYYDACDCACSELRDSHGTRVKSLPESGRSSDKSDCRFDDSCFAFDGARVLATTLRMGSMDGRRVRPCDVIRTQLGVVLFAPPNEGISVLVSRRVP